MDLDETLKQIGLSDKESKVYLSCLQLGKATVLNIAKKADLKRPNTYLVLDGLIKKNLTSSIIEGKKTYYIAENPSKLIYMIRVKESLLNNILPNLNAVYNTSENKPNIRYYEGLNGLKNIWEETLEIKSKEMFWISPVKDIFETVGKEYLEKYIERRTEKGIRIKSLRVSFREEEDYKYKEKKTFAKTLRDIRFVPKEFNIKTTIIIYDDKVAVISSAGEGFGVVIESKEFSNTMKILYDLLWKSSKK